MAEIAHFRGPGGVIWKMELPLDRIMAKQERKGILRRVNADGSPYRPGTTSRTPPAEEPPAQSAPKADWVGWAVRNRGLSVDDAEAMTKADLVELAG